MNSQGEQFWPDELARQEFVRGPRRQDWAGNAEEFDGVRTAAETVVCPYCHAPVSRHCVNPITKQPLKHFPAHCPRIKAARKATA